MTRLTALLFLVPAIALAEITGHDIVIDGQTLNIFGEDIRLSGVEAPARDQVCLEDRKPWPCGEHAASALAAHIGDREVNCFGVDRDRERRLLAVCLLDGKADLNGWMVAEGWALAGGHNASAYATEQQAAKAAGRGMWRGVFVAPQDWRAGKRFEQAATAVDPDLCPIKGSVAHDGRRIYYLPEAQSYPLIRIEAENGERWFCSKTEAEDAGWRPAHG